jgi:hypothetical protein
VDNDPTHDRRRDIERPAIAVAASTPESALGFPCDGTSGTPAVTALRMDMVGSLR